MHLLDDVDIGLLRTLTRDGRASLAELARDAGMSAPSVAERLRRLEERGVIAGYAAEIAPAALGLALGALIRIRPMAGQLQKVARLIEEAPEIVECHRVTGDDCFVATAHVADMLRLERLIDRLIPFAQTNSAIIQSSPVRRRPPPFAGGSRAGRRT